MNNVPMVHTRIAEMAAYHVDTIRAVQPHGPYFVGGMCAGGVIAFEVAKQLQERGESVGLVAIIDAADPAAPPKAWHFAGQRLQSFSTAFRSDQRPPAHELALKALKKIKNLGIYLLQDRWIKARDEIRMRLFRFCIRRELPLPRALQQISVRTVYLFAEKNYRVDRPFEGRLLLCRATVGEGADEPYIARFSDPLLGWGPRASGGVDVVDIPGGHSSMLQEPNVDALADALRDRLQNSTSIRPLPEHPYTERAHAEAAVSTV
jgi:thioesterase domain-containing protein